MTLYAFPASFAQRRLWFLDQLSPGNAAYHMPFALHLTGALDAGAMQRALQEIVRRHETLRTTFRETDGQPMQIVREAAELPLIVQDVQELSGPERMVRVQELILAECVRPFALAEDLPLRVTLYRLAPEEHVLLFVLHHLVSDGWSNGVIARELSALYSAYSLGVDSPLAEPEVQYADFAHYQGEWLDSEDYAEQLAFWKQTLAGHPFVLPLPTDHPRPAKSSGRGGTVPFVLPPDLTQKLRGVALSEGATLFMTLLTAFNVLLARYAEVRDVLVGTPVAGRILEEVEGTVGLFANSIVLRTVLPEAATFADLLQGVKKAALAAYAHQEMPFEKLVEELQPERSLGLSPLFQVMFSLQTASGPLLELPGVAATELELPRDYAKFDLLLDVTETPEQLLCMLEYSTDLFKRETVEKMAGHLLTLLYGAAEDPQSWWQELPGEAVPIGLVRHEWKRDGNAPQEYVAPRTPAEELVAGIFAGVLRVERVGAHDDFFALGGHSLLGAQAMSRIRTAFGVSVPLDVLFETPTAAEVAAKVEKMLQTAGSADGGSASLVPVSRDGELALSFAQQRLYVLHQILTEKSAYNMPYAVRLAGSLDVAALEESLAEIIRRHEALRTTFAEAAFGPVQVIAPEGAMPLAVTDLSGLEAVAREQEWRQRVQAEAETAFDLQKGPLVRCSLLKLNEAEHILMLNFHHIVFDGWSVGVFIRELTALYSGEQLPERALQYADFAAWQREWLSGEVLEEQLLYWKKQLGGELPLLELPTDRPRPQVQTYAGAMLPFRFGKELTAELKRWSQEQQATLFMTLIAGFTALLHRYSGQEDICVGTPIAGRNREEIEEMIGFFVNTLVLRSDFSANPKFSELVAQVRQTSLGAYAHQDVPFEMLVKELQPARNMSASPLFQAMFVLQNAHLEKVALPGLTLEPLELEGRTAKFDLLVSLSETDGELVGTWEYNTDLFDEATMLRMIGHFETLVGAITAGTDLPVGEIGLLTEQEIAEVAPSPETQTVPEQLLQELFEEQAAKTPDGLALVMGEQEMTYRELNEEANRLARHLQALGAGPNMPVGLSMERSPEMITGLLAILKAGGCYVPLDPAYPRERLELMVQGSQLTILLTNCADAGWDATVASVIDVERDRAQWAAYGAENPAYQLTQEHLAYVLYTSGSTGIPKGVAMPGRALANLAVWQRRDARIPQARTLQFTSLNFDVSSQEIFATLCAGGTLVLIPEAMRKDLSQLPKLVQEQGVERMYMPFVALQHVAELCVEQNMHLPALREVMTAGEQLQITPVVREFFKRHRECLLYNQYGPTETHVVTSHRLEGPAEQWTLLPSLGKAITNTSALVLDARLQPVPIGVRGEICIGGVSVAHGYLQREDLTAERFVNSPYGRLYKTGDIGRLLLDGTIEYLGRLDHQVKIRGHRIELGEIEATLNLHADVREAVVTARADLPGGGKRLAAYVVPQPDSASGPAEWREFLRAKLPDYMVPSAFAVVEQFPLTPSGKVDRKALPAPTAAPSTAEAGDQAPQNEIERQLVEIWSQLLGVERVGIHDNFFDLGGDSLLILQLHKQLVPQFPHKELTVVELFRHPTIHTLASFLAVETVEQPDFEEVENRVEKQKEMLARRKQMMKGRRG
ncbi:amino acid adenylation domain-containing protein [Tumebacillus sp. BK434]|uniref:non-ribosomal peptide synthetase n=1 Tax=Tumebacillus sp. BK434 TaxID=2512169 RepID=UPI00104CAFE9|nr:non-ribosomal peptide synthetase [Tumebacillus sp. BK434]TCP54464.1 amino acid adenylation domain-containing protein [Tumebacillus sp. BK434]